MDQVTGDQAAAVDIARTGDELLDAILDLADAAFAEGRAVERGHLAAARRRHSATLAAFATVQRMIGRTGGPDSGSGGPDEAPTSIDQATVPTVGER